jgi:hypothetical protein
LFTVLVSATVFAAGSRATAQAPELEVFYDKLEPRAGFKYKWKGAEAECSAGVFRWAVPKTQYGTSSLDRNFTGYCAEVLVPITADKMYRFRVNSLYAAANYGLATGDGAALAAQRRATFVKELFGRYFRDPVLNAVNADEAVALQVALWEVIQETEPAQGTPKLDLFSGDFQANYPPTEAPAYVLKAQQYLDSLTGNADVFYENPDLRGRELIRLQGIANADGVVAQSQFALRYAGGGGTGLAGNRSLTGGGGSLLAGGFGGPFGGFGSGSGGGLLAGTGLGGASAPGGASSSVPGGSATAVPGGSAVTTTSAPPTTTPITVPVNGPPSTSPPSTTPPVVTTPVPAPAALTLVVVAAGTIGAWRVGTRLLSVKRAAAGA